MGLLAQMTSENGRGLSGIRQSYLGTAKELQSEDKAVLASATNHMEQLRDLFGRIGSNYQRLAMTQESR